MNAFIEQAIKKNPEQYMWILKFFKTQVEKDNTYSAYHDEKYWITGYKR
jgi:lauroyl/myristoyl acyltransferase